MAQPETFDRILLIKPSAVGDVIHALPVLVKLRRRFPAARIDWLVTPANADLVRGHPALTGIVPFDRRGLAGFFYRPAAARALLALVRQLRSARYDLVLDLQGLLRSALLGLLSGGKTRIGFAQAREGAAWTYTRHIPVPTLEAHAADRNLWVGPLLGLDDDPPDFTLHLPPAAATTAERLLAEAGLANRPFAVLVPATTWETKHWRVEGFADVARALLADGLGVVLTGATSERQRCATVARDAPGAVDLCGRTNLAELAEVLRRSAVCLTNDTGAMHLAAALGRPLVAVFGPTNPLRTGPYGLPQAVVRADLPCSPCYLRKLSQCPHAHACMAQVTAEQVLARVRAALGR